MKIQLFLDEDVHAGLAHALRKRRYDVIHAQELDRKGLPDLNHKQQHYTKKPVKSAKSVPKK